MGLPLSLRLSRAQETRVESGEIEIRVDMSIAFPGCFIASRQGLIGTGRSPRQAVDALERKYVNG